MTTMEEFIPDVGMLSEAGLVAIKQGDEESAKKLFNAVGQIDPASTITKMGYGLIALHKMELVAAKKHFHEILEQESSNDRAKAFLAFAEVLSILQEEGNEEKMKSLQEGSRLANEVLNNSDSESTRKLAQSIIDWQEELIAKVKDQENKPFK